MRLLCVRQEHIVVVSNFLYPLCEDMRLLRICHAKTPEGTAPKAQTFSLPLGALQITCQENWADGNFLVYVYRNFSLKPRIGAIC